jgi:hypothetical protein
MGYFKTMGSLIIADANQRTPIKMSKASRPRDNPAKIEIATPIAKDRA